MAGLYRGKVQSDCPITYVQNKKYPSSSEKVYPNQNVSNKGLLKNPYNTISEPIAQLGKRPVMITSDMWGNVYSRNETMLVSNVTNNNLLKNPYNNLSESVAEKKVLSKQRIKDINDKTLPSFMSQNKGVSELAMKCLLMINNKNVKLLTIALMKYLVTKKIDDVRINKDTQKILSALNIYNQLIVNAKKIYGDFGNDETQLAETLKPLVEQYEMQLIQLLPFLGQAVLPSIDADISQALAELAIVSNALSRMFEQDKMIQSTSTLSTQQILSAGGVNPNSASPTQIPSTLRTAPSVIPIQSGLNGSGVPASSIVVNGNSTTQAPNVPSSRRVAKMLTAGLAVGLGAGATYLALPAGAIGTLAGAAGSALVAGSSSLMGSVGTAGSLIGSAIGQELGSVSQGIASSGIGQNIGNVVSSIGDIGSYIGQHLTPEISELLQSAGLTAIVNSLGEIQQINQTTGGVAEMGRQGLSLTDLAILNQGTGDFFFQPQGGFGRKRRTKTKAPSKPRKPRKPRKE